MTPDYEEHGGHCCGTSHIYNFGYHSYEIGKGDIKYTNKQTFKVLARVLEDLDGDLECSIFAHRVEVILTQGQTKEYPEWVEALTMHGFKPEHAWHNGNSKNICIAYYYRPSDVPIPKTAYYTK